MNFMVQQHKEGKTFRNYRNELYPYFDTLPVFQQETPPPIEERYKVEPWTTYSDS